MTLTVVGHLYEVRALHINRIGRIDRRHIPASNNLRGAFVATASNSIEATSTISP